MKLHPELMALDPFDRTEVNRQRRRLVGEQDTHSHVTAAENLSIALDGAPLQRQVGQITFADKWSPPEDDRIEKREPMIGPRIMKRRHHSLRAVGLYRGRHWARYPTLGGGTLTRETGSPAGCFCVFGLSRLFG